MTQAEAPIPTTLNPIPPALATRNTAEFYAFFEVTRITKNYLSAVMYIDNAWSGAYLTGAEGAAAGSPAPMANCKVQAISVGPDVYAVYMTSATQLAVIKRGDSGWVGNLPVLGLTAIKNFTLFTDGTSLYVLVNDNNTLKYAVLSGSSWSQVTLTGNSGKTSAPAPLTGSQLSAAFVSGNINCAYQGTSATGHVQTLSIYGVPSAPVWQQAPIMSSGDPPKGTKLFVYNGYLFVVFTHNDGTIEVHYFNTTQATPQWQLAYESAGYTTVTAAQAPDVAVVNGGIFIVYPDTSGNLQATYFLFGLWNTAQLTGGGSQLMPAAPAAQTAVSMTVYGDTSLHIGYNAPGNVLEDVFFVPFGWYQQQLFPNLPSA